MVAAKKERMKEVLPPVLVWRCEVLQRAGFAQTPRYITAVAEEILRKRIQTVRWAANGYAKASISTAQR